jgi:hypothetical protein
MPISNYVPTSAIARPGVCTSTTRPASPYEGQVIYETDTDRTLVWNGSAWVFLSTSTAGDVGLVQVFPTGVTNGTIGATGTVTVGNAVSTVDILGCFTSQYTNYRIVFSNITPSTNTQDLRFKLLSGSTASSTGYAYASVFVTLGTTTVTGLSATNATISIASSVNTTTSRHAGSLDLFMPNLAQFTQYAATGYISRTDISAMGVTGSHQVATAYDGIQFITSTATITGGTITVYGYRN